MKDEVDLPIEGIELGLEFLKRDMHRNPSAKARFHEEAERVLREFAEYVGIGQGEVEVIHVHGTPLMVGYIQMRAESFAIEIGSHLITDGVGARIAHRRPRMRAFGCNTREVSIEAVYDPVMLQRCMKDCSISVRPACFADD